MGYDPEKRRASYRAWVEQNRERRRQTWRAWWEKHKDEHNARCRRAKDARRRKLLRALLVETGGVCRYCGTALTDELGRLDTATVDHIFPRVNGGNGDRENLVAACMGCNRAKGDRTPEEWDPERFGGLAGGVTDDVPF